MIVTTSGRFHVAVRIEMSPEGRRRRIIRHSEYQRKTCLMGQEDNIRGRGSLVKSCDVFEVILRLRRAGRMVDRTEGLLRS